MRPREGTSRLARAAPLLLGLLGAAAFSPALGAGFVADDHVLMRTVDLVENPVWPFAHTDLGGERGSGHFYRPLWVLLNAAVLEVSGSGAGLAHLVNLLLYAAVVGATYVLLRRFVAAAPAALAAAVFAVYPPHGESVAWVSGNTELLVALLMLGALLALPRRVAVACVLAALAATAKETAFVLPLLVFALEAGRRWVDGEPLTRAALRIPILIGVVQLAVLVTRGVVVGGLGGYSSDPFTPGRAAGAAASYAVAALSPPALEVLRHPVLLLVPAAIAVLAGWAMLRLRRADAPRFRLALVGLGFAVIAVLPALNLPLDLNSGNGARLLMVPSIGLALLLAALLPPEPGRRAVLAAVPAVALLLALSLSAARDWSHASDVADALVRDGERLAPRGGEIVLLTIPQGYRTAHVFQDGYDVALFKRRPDLTRITWCVPIHMRSRDPERLAVRPAGPRWSVATTSSAPIDFPVFSDSERLTDGCSYDRSGGRAGEPVGRGLRAEAIPTPTGHPVAYAYFDGDRLVPVAPR
jgi:hypothetical protein